MNSKTFITVATAVIALVSAASAVADDAPNGRLTRAEVRAAAIEARNNAKPVSGEKAGESQAPFTSVLTRAQVVAEAREAIRIGAFNFGGDISPQTGPTSAQLEQIRMAGLKALTMSVAAR